MAHGVTAPHCGANNSRWRPASLRVIIFTKGQPLTARAAALNVPVASKEAFRAMAGRAARRFGRSCRVDRRMDTRVLALPSMRHGEKYRRAQLLREAWDGAKAAHDALQHETVDVRPWDP